MDAARRRFLLWLSVLSLFAVTGSVHRLWVRHWVSKSEASQQAKALKFKEQVDRVREEFDRLPSESKAFVKEVLQAQHGELVATPFLMKLSCMAPKAAEGASLEERVLEGARALGSVWCLAETWLVRLLWAGCVLLLAIGLAGVFLDQPAWLAFSAKATFLMADQWLLWLSIGASLVFAVLGQNSWLGMPISFYAAPAVVLFGAFMLKLQQQLPVDAVVPEALSSLSAPAASLLLVGALRFLG